MKPILFSNPRSRKFSKSTTCEEAQLIKARVFTKCFPKYLREISFDIKYPPAKSKLKKAKILQIFKALDGIPSLEWKQLLGDKIKNIKAGCYCEPAKRFPQKIKILSRLTSMKITLPTIPYKYLPIYVDPKESSYIAQAWKNMKLLKDLRYLKLETFANNHLDLIKQFNESPRLLSSLKVLSITCERQDQEVQVINALENSKNLLKYVTFLSLGSLCSPAHQKSFQGFANACPNLQELFLEFSCRKIVTSWSRSKDYSSESFQVETNFLKTLETFHNLRFLRLDIADVFTFFRDFGPLPPLVQSLTLNFIERISPEILLQINDKFADLDESKIMQFFNENPMLVKFYNTFQEHKNLQDLSIFFGKHGERKPKPHYPFQHYLSQGILKRIPSLKNLQFLNGGSLRRGPNVLVWSAIEEISLSQMLQACHNLNDELETLRIGSNRTYISNFDLSDFRNKFPQLSLVELTGIIPEDISSLCEQILGLGDSIATIRLCSFLSNSSECLLELLRQLSQVQMRERLKINIEIKLMGLKDKESSAIDCEDAIKRLQECSEEYPILQGVALKLRTDFVDVETMSKFLDAYGKKFETFEL